MRRLFILVFVSLILGVGQVTAELVWKSKSIRKDAGALDTKVTATFHFSNRGKNDVEIESITTSCGCTTTTLTKKIYRPGEAGSISVTLDIGRRLGLQTKTVSVKIKGVKNLTILTMKTQIPTLMTFRPSIVYWRQGEATDPKYIELDVAEKKMSVVKVESDHGSIRAKLEPWGKGYRIKINPTRLDSIRDNQ